MGLLNERQIHPLHKPNHEEQAHLAHPSPVHPPRPPPRPPGSLGAPLPRQSEEETARASVFDGGGTFYGGRILCGGWAE